MKYGDTELLLGDAYEVLTEIPSRSIQMCVTSPAYFNLRNYGVEGQMGQETTLDQYIENLVEVLMEVRRTLKDTGVLFLNIGDSYAGSGRGPSGATGFQNAEGRQGFVNPGAVVPLGMKPKDLMGVPWAVAFALRDAGWYLRSDIIWQKPSCMPSSVRDRPTTSKEYLFLLSKRARYLYNGDAIREPTSVSYRKDKRPVGILRQRVNDNTKYDREDGQYRKQDDTGNPTYTGFNARWKASATKDNTTRNARDVWTINTQSRSDKHTASFPDELARRCILVGSRIGDTVLDPFVGRGTTACMCQELGRKCIGIDINYDYLKLTRKNLGYGRLPLEYARSVGYDIQTMQETAW